DRPRRLWREPRTAGPAAERAPKRAWPAARRATPAMRHPTLDRASGQSEHTPNAWAYAQRESWEDTVKPSLGALLGAAILSISAPAIAETLTIATVNNGDMIRMQGLTTDFTAKNPDITVKWVTLEENVLRQRVTTDIATKGGQFDVLTIGTYEVPIWGKQSWLLPLEKLGASYDVNDLLAPIRAGLTVNGKLYAVPFYGESSMTMYRKDLLQKAGLSMPANPTWDFIADAARKMTAGSTETFGACCRG